MDQYANVKNIIFDLGGVLLNLDYSLTTKAFQKIDPAFNSVDALYSKQQENHLFEDFETGTITSQQFRNGIRGLLQHNIDDRTIDSAWNAMLLDFPHDRLSLLEKLHPKYRLFLLSNTNAIHIQAYSEILKSTFGLNNLSKIFEKEYYSYQIGMRKPNKEIFQFVLSENNLDPSQTLFIDDSPQHIESGKKNGIQTLLIEQGKTILEELSDLTA